MGLSCPAVRGVNKAGHLNPVKKRLLLQNWEMNSINPGHQVSETLLPSSTVARGDVRAFGFLWPSSASSSEEPLPPSACRVDSAAH